MTAAALVSRDYLVDQDRLLRPALDTWATELAEHLEAALTTPGQDSGTLHDAFVHINQAGFVVAAAGDLTTAARICKSQLTLVAHHTASRRDPRLLGLAVQPWVNLGRLHALRRRTHRAAPHFRLAEDYDAQRGAELGPCTISAAAWAAIVAAEPSLPQVLWNIHANESVKTHLMASDPASALRVAERLRGMCPVTAQVFRTEGEILALLHNGQPDSAVALAVDEQPSSFYGELAFHLHQVTGLAMMGDVQRARRSAAGLLAVLAHVQPRQEDAPTLMRQLRQLGTLSEALELPRYALAVNLRGLELCREYDDQPLRFRFLGSLLSLAPTHRSAPDWEQEHSRLSSDSLYAEVRRAGRHADGVSGKPPLVRLIAAVNALCLRTA
ncbi:hypothetical protein ACFQ6N_37540 [Kitasatospora sp. NPDC056446]|uniref:hypothetical protein n=1 Tax=Kitasatospora sp. NPDC056446 TaxID=3345819 RepID=UPI0036AAFC08